MVQRRTLEEWELEVLSCLARAPRGETPSIAEMAAQIKPGNPKAAQTSVYDALERLQQHGEVIAPPRPPATTEHSRPKRAARGWKLTAKGRRRHNKALAPSHPAMPRQGRIRRRPFLSVLGRVAGGQPISIDAYRDLYRGQTLRSALALTAGHYLLEVAGESMEQLGIRSGDYIVVRPQTAEQTVPYEVVVVLVRDQADGSLTVKRWVPDGRYIRLEPAPYREADGSASHEAQYYDRDEVEVHGKPVAIVRRLDRWAGWPPHQAERGVLR
jgi:SOS-response transcriptional repressor LexA